MDKKKYSGKTCRLLSMLSMTSAFFLVEIIVGYFTNSMALVADAFHMLSDVVALFIGFASVRISKWRTQKNTFGWARAEVLGALVNAVFLIALCFSIFVESLKRLVEKEEIHNPKMLVIVGVLGLVVNFIGLCLFRGHTHSHGSSHGDKSENVALVENKIGGNSDDVVISHTEEATEEVPVKIQSSSQLNMRGVFLHVLGDALGSVIVIISALIIWFAEGDWRFYVDPAMSIAMVFLILSTTIPLLRESGLILLQTVPTHIQVKDIKEKLEKISGVLAVHEFHVWQLAGNRIIASAHVRCQNIEEYMHVAVKIKELFHNEGIHSTTIQPEFVEFEEIIPGRDCALECGPDKKCYTDTCCPTTPSASSMNQNETDYEQSTSNRNLTELPNNIEQNVDPKKLVVAYDTNKDETRSELTFSLNSSTDFENKRSSQTDSLKRTV
ncbi:zinc cadmium resistance 1-like [Octopus vulgaris]|nr:zinc cadmium resistance 1-like [Octopus vulgaris]